MMLLLPIWNCLNIQYYIFLTDDINIDNPNYDQWNKLWMLWWFTHVLYIACVAKCIWIAQLWSHPLHQMCDDWCRTPQTSWLNIWCSIIIHCPWLLCGDNPLYCRRNGTKFVGLRYSWLTIVPNYFGPCLGIESTGYCWIGGLT